MCVFFYFRHSLPQDAGSYFNEETSVLEVPVTILIADKVCNFISYAGYSTDSRCKSVIVVNVHLMITNLTLVVEVL